MPEDAPVRLFLFHRRYDAPQRHCFVWADWYVEGGGEVQGDTCLYVETGYALWLSYC